MVRIVCDISRLPKNNPKSRQNAGVRQHKAPITGLYEIFALYFGAIRKVRYLDVAEPTNNPD